MLVNKTISVQPHLPFSPPSFHGYLTSVLAPEGWGGGRWGKEGGVGGAGGVLSGPIYHVNTKKCVGIIPFYDGRVSIMF